MCMRWKSLFFASFVTVSLHCTGSQWQSPAPITDSAPTYPNDVFTTYAAETDQIFAAWVAPVDSGSFHPTYAIASFVDGSWVWGTPEILDSNANAGLSNVALAYLSETNQVIAVWQENGTNDVEYAIASYSGGVWSFSTPAQVSTGTAATFVYVSYLGAVANQILVTWSDLNNSNYPSYSVGSWGGGAWSFGTVGTLGVTNAYYGVSTCYNPTTNQVFATWQNTSSYEPLYNYATVSGGSSLSWAGETLIVGSTNVNDNVICTYDPTTEQILATWVDNGNMQEPTYSFASTSDGGSSWSWSAKNTIGEATAAAGFIDVYTAANQATGEIIATWSDNATQHPTYSIFQDGVWGAPAFINSVSVTSTAAGAGDVIPLVLPSQSQMLATWAESDNTPTYALYSSSSAINPPTDLRGVRKVNNFGTLREYYDTLSWDASSSSDIVSYLVYANGVEVAVLPSYQLCYQAHNQKKSASVRYEVKAQNSSGTQSSAATVTVGGKR